MKAAAPALLLLLLAACSAPRPAAFREVAAESGVDFIHRSGAAGRFLLPEIMGGGGGFLDVDGDGLLDIYVVQSAQGTNRLFRNRGDGSFEDVTAAYGAGDTGYGMGCAAGDYDNDGDVDLYVTNLGANVLYRNDGGRFTDVTESAGTGDPRWSTSAAFCDFDADGDLDLFVTNYVGWSDTPVFLDKQCFSTTGARDYCSPRAYGAPTPDSLYRNDGDGSFTDVGDTAGIHHRSGTGLGVLCTDLDSDGALDVYVANDQMPSFAWLQQPDGTFRESGSELGVAVDESGKSQAGMGVATADVDADGDFDLFKVHLHRESHILYVNHGNYYDDATAAWGLSATTRAFTGFGTALFDYDLDGRIDVFIANGRVQYVSDAAPGSDIYAEPNQLLRQATAGRFVDATAELGPAFDLRENSRAAAFGDYDNDGDVDVLVVNRDGPVRLLRNDTERHGSFFQARVVERHGRDAHGAILTVNTADGSRIVRADPAYGYCATNDPRAHAGLGRTTRIDNVEVRWPDGERSTHGPFDAGAIVRIEQPAASDERGEFEQIARRLREGDNEFFGRRQVELLRRRLEQSTAEDRPKLRGLLAVELLRLGEVDQAIDAIESAMRNAPAGLRTGLHRIRGLTYLRQAEIRNCVARHNADCCIFPLQGGGVHEERGPAINALESYAACLEAKPDDLKLRWLLNLVAMALGRYPDGVDERQRIPPRVFESEIDVPRFVDVAPGLGVDTFNLCGGCVVDDVDDDGDLDIVTSTSDPDGPVSFYRSDGKGGFEDRSSASNLDRQLGGLNIQGADYDNDGDVDLLILRGAWLYDDGRIRNSLLRNDGDGTFTDVSASAGLAVPAMPTQAAAWGDFDNDGDLDVYIGNESRLARGDDTGNFPSQLFRNNGDGSFTDVARAAGVTNDRYAKGVAAGDYDDDGDLDLYVSNVGANRLYRNDGDGTFTDVAERAGVVEPSGRSFATWFFDYDNDGRLDLFVAAYDAKVEDVAADYLGLPHRATAPRLYRNDGDGGFTDVAARSGLDRALLPMGANFGDLDNDGWLDIYLATGDPDFQTLMPNVMLRNDRGVRFQDVTTAGGFGHLQKGHGVALADLDNDGDQDIYHQLGGFYPGDAFANALFRNPGNDNGFLVVELVGTTSNRAAFGARVAITVDGPSGRRTIHRAPGSVSSFGGSPRRQEIGIGDAQRIVEIRVDWPVSRSHQVFRDALPNTSVRIVEGHDGFETLDFQSFRLGR